MSWIPAIWTWLVHFFGAAAMVVHLEKRVVALEISEKECHEHREKCEATLKMHQDQIETLDAKLFVAMVEVCDEGRITKMTLGACKLFHWKEEHAKGKEVSELIAYGDRAKFCETFEKAKKSRSVGHIVAQELQVLTRNTDYFPMAVNLSAYISEDQWFAAVEFKEPKYVQPATPSRSATT